MWSELVGTAVGVGLFRFEGSDFQVLGQINSYAALAPPTASHTPLEFANQKTRSFSS